MTTPQQSGWFAGRTRLITIASIVAIGVAGATAIGANIGILNAASNNEVGNLSAAGDLTPSTQVVDVYLDGQGRPSPSASATPSGSQRFTVDSAGTVDVSADGGTPRVDLRDARQRLDRDPGDIDRHRRGRHVHGWHEDPRVHRHRRP